MASIRLHNGEFAEVDDSDFPDLSRFTWYKSGSYAVTNIRLIKGRWRQILMHRMLMLASGRGQQVDHIDGNGLNNTKANLRVCLPAENGRNRRLSSNNLSGYKGVSFYKRTGKWVAHIKVNYKSKHLGYYESPEAAHDAYKAAATIFHGSFASF